MPESELLQTARRIADEVLFPRAIETDGAPLLPSENLDALARAGLYGLAGPPSANRPALSNMSEFGLVVEALAGGCLTTAFVWIQHHRGVRALVDTPNAALRDRYLEDMCAGRVRAGVVFGGTHEPAQVRATRVDGGWQLDGVVPWVTGLGRIDQLYTMSRSDDGHVVSVLLDAREGNGIEVRPLRLVAANASGTVAVTFSSAFVASDRVVSVEPYLPAPAHDGGGRPNGSLSLGVAARCCRMIGPSPLDAELIARRQQLDTATDETMAEARAAATELAIRAASALAVKSGSPSLLLEQHPQRLLREAMFLLNFGTRPAIRDGLLQRFGAAS
jgi:alkylation response protein AidB-like acyl-CoA dehydrogenase